MNDPLVRFAKETSGTVTVFFVLILPVLLLIGGLATDAVLLNAQKRHVQAQADLAAQSAARLLPDTARARTAAQRVVNANADFDDVLLTRADVQFGSMAATGAFQAHANQENPTGASVIRVQVPSRFSPLLLGPVLSDEAVTIRRTAYAEQTGLAVFTLRNRLLRVNTRESLLDPVLSGLGLGLTVDALDYTGLASARVKLDQLLGLASLGVGAGALTFNDVLDLPVTTPVLLGRLVNQNALPPSAVPAGGTGRVVTLREVMAVSPQLLRARIGDVLPDVTVNGFDTLMAVLGLAAPSESRVNVAAGLDLPPLASVTANVGIVRPPVIGIGRPGDLPAPRARVSQLSLLLKANVLGQANAALLDLTANIQLGAAEATLTSLNCSATAGTDILARFQVQTAVGQVGMTVGLLDSRAGIAPKDLNTLPIAGTNQQISIRLDQFRQPVLVPNEVQIVNTVQNLTQVLEGMRGTLVDKVNACKPGPLSALLCPLIGVVGMTVSALVSVLTGLANNITWLLANLGADSTVRGLMNLLGINLAQAELILDDYRCSSILVR